MTWAELVREYYPNISDEQIKFILWEKTGFPIVSVKKLREQLQALKESEAENERI